jgi:hypothetical protein
MRCWAKGPLSGMAAWSLARAAYQLAQRSAPGQAVSPRARTSPEPDRDPAHALLVAVAPDGVCVQGRLPR